MLNVPAIFCTPDAKIAVGLVQVVHELQEGVVDECGVCGGSASTCAISVVAQLQITANAKRINQTLQVHAVYT